MQLDDGDVLFTSGLLGFHESSGIVDAGDEAAGDLGVKCTRVTSLFNFKDFLNPSNDFVGGWVRWLIKINDTVIL